MVKGLKDKQKGCMETIRVLEKDIQGHKKEIREREETIADKDRRISDLKKRNQVQQLHLSDLGVTIS
jgi:prefoldin subunit 5